MWAVLKHWGDQVYLGKWGLLYRDKRQGQAESYNGLLKACSICSLVYVLILGTEPETA